MRLPLPNPVFSLAFSATLMFGGSALGGVLAGPITNPANGHHYYLLTSATWHESEAEAISLGGHLVTINDEAENTWVYSTFGNYDGSPRGLWIGLTDEGQEGEFVWVDGSSSTYRNWSEGEPNNGHVNGENIVHMWDPTHQYGGQWNDQNETATEAFSVSIHGVVELPGPRVSVRVSEVAVEWFAVEGVNYQVQYRDEIEDMWMNLGGVITGAGEEMEIGDPIAKSSLRRIYRVVEIP